MTLNVCLDDWVVGGWWAAGSFVVSAGLGFILFVFVLRYEKKTCWQFNHLISIDHQPPGKEGSMIRICVTFITLLVKCLLSILRYHHRYYHLLHVDIFRN